jgi:hypothetical protein
MLASVNEHSVIDLSEVKSARYFSGLIGITFRDGTHDSFKSDENGWQNLRISMQRYNEYYKNR